MRGLIAIAMCVGCASSGRPSGGDGPGGDGSSGLSCSADLHDVVDGNGDLVMTCPVDQGCANGACVPACMAAAASQGNVGCDFVLATPAFHTTSLPPCFAVFLANHWGTDASITIERGGHTYDATAFGRIPDGTSNVTSWPALAGKAVGSEGVGVLFLSTDPRSMNAGASLKCPITPALEADYGSAINGTGIGTSWHITTSAPVSAYDMLPYGGAMSFLPSAELLLPTTAWGTNYVAASPIPSSGPGWGQVVAAQDGTDIMISPTTSLPGGTGVTPAPANQVSTFHLDAGQYIQWMDSGDMSGSVITASKPVSFTGGSGYLCVSSATSTRGGCDSAHQMIPPVSALGFEYVAPPHATRRADLLEESIRYRLVGAAAGTTLVFDPPVAGAPATLGVGQIAEIEATGPFTIKSQDDMHPFYVGQYMAGDVLTTDSRGATSISSLGPLGDEEFVNILPPAQWLSSYVFFTDPTYATTNLVVVRKAVNGVFNDVTVDCLGTVSGWKPVGASGEYEITNADLVRGAAVGSCTNGRHTAHSVGPFGLMVWGLDAASSYAYPAGGNVGKINPVVVIL
jgi:hypothetical protein